jgi:hypothetical protein
MGCMSPSSRWSSADGRGAAWLRELEERTFTRERLAAIGDLSEPMRTVVASADRVAHDFQFAGWRPGVTANVAKELEGGLFAIPIVR